MTAQPFLSGVRVLELGAYWAGPYAAGLLADMGAEVIKVEDTNHPPLRVPRQGPDGELVLQGTPHFNVMNRNKLGVSINLRMPEGVELVRALAAASDILIENFAPSSRRQMGIDHEDLRPACPALVHVSLSGFGSSGPLSDYRGFGPTIEAMSGLDELLGYPGDLPGSVGMGFTDPLSGAYGAMAALGGLAEARRTGRGGHIDVSQLEGVMACLPEELMFARQTGTVPARAGNDDPSQVPSGVYPCRGERRWLALTVTDDAAWVRFAGLIGLPAEQATALLKLPARLAARRDIDRWTAAWSRQQELLQATELLREAGIAASPVNEVADLVADEHLHARRFLFEADGELFHAPTFALVDGAGNWTRPAIRCPAPTLGQHTQQVLGGLLGLAPAQINRLRDAGAVRW